MLNGNELSIVERMTILGVIITNHLSWTTHASKDPVLNFRTRLQSTTRLLSHVYYTAYP